MKSLINVVIYFALIYVVVSCSRKTYDNEYKGENNYKNFYLVDTINIVDPVRIHSTKFGGQFILSKSILKKYNNKIDFFSRPDVFFLGTDLYRDLQTNEYEKYSYFNDGGCEFVYLKSDFRDLEVYKLKSNSTLFILGLINANYFYLKHNSYGSFIYPEKNIKKDYYKIVYPLCE